MELPVSVALSKSRLKEFFEKYMQYNSMIGNNTSMKSSFVLVNDVDEQHQWLHGREVKVYIHTGSVHVAAVQRENLGEVYFDDMIHADINGCNIKKLVYIVHEDSDYRLSPLYLSRNNIEELYLQDKSLNTLLASGNIIKNLYINSKHEYVIFNTEIRNNRIDRIVSDKPLVVEKVFKASKELADRLGQILGEAYLDKENLFYIVFKEGISIKSGPVVIENDSIEALRLIIQEAAIRTADIVRYNIKSMNGKMIYHRRKGIDD